MLAISKVGKLIKLTINIIKGKKESVTIITNHILGVSLGIRKITRAMYLMSATN
jgi:hypothetical protein